MLDVDAGARGIGSSDASRPRASPGQNDVLVEGRRGADRAVVGDVVEEDVKAVSLILEAQVTHAPTRPVVGADRQRKIGLLRG